MLLLHLSTQQIQFFQLQQYRRDAVTQAHSRRCTACARHQVCNPLPKGLLGHTATRDLLRMLTGKALAAGGQKNI